MKTRNTTETIETIKAPKPLKIIIPAPPQPKLADVLAIFMITFIEMIGLKVPGSHSAPFWFNNLSH